jgi:hypothetical protein
MYEVVRSDLYKVQSERTSRPGMPLITLIDQTWQKKACERWELGWAASYRNCEPCANITLSYISK